jgi:hypothetical protein
MTTLPANSTFLPVLDDLLSPDFRTSTIPGQTPQTPAETPVSATGGKIHSFAEDHTGPLTTKVGFTASREQLQTGDGQQQLQQSVYGQMNGSFHGGKKHQSHHGHYQGHTHHHQQHLHQNHDHNAASKIQKWWKSRNARVRVGENGNSVTDVKAERAKHAIRHHRTEEHVR